MKKKTTNDDSSQMLFNEIHENASKDRERLEKFYDKLLTAAANGDPELLFHAADGVAKLTAELTRNNQQLVEIAKLKIKKEIVKDATDSLGDDEREEFFNEIGESLGDN